MHWFLKQILTTYQVYSILLGARDKKGFVSYGACVLVGKSGNII